MFQNGTTLSSASSMISLAPILTEEVESLKDSKYDDQDDFTFEKGLEETFTIEKSGDTYHDCENEKMSEKTIEKPDEFDGFYDEKTEESDLKTETQKKSTILTKEKSSKTEEKPIETKELQTEELHTKEKPKEIEEKSIGNGKKQENTFTKHEQDIEQNGNGVIIERQNSFKSTKKFFQVKLSCI